MIFINIYLKKIIFLRFGLCFILCLLMPFVYEIGCVKAYGENSAFSQEEMEWIKSHPVIRIVVNREPAPLSTWGDKYEKKPPHNPPDRKKDSGTEPGRFPGSEPSGQQGIPLMAPGETNIPLVKVKNPDKIKFRGIAADYLGEISGITGIRFIVTLAAENNFQEIFKALSKGRADLMPTYMLNQQAQKKHQALGLYVTQPYINMPVVIVTRTESQHINDIEVLKIMKVAGTLPTRGKLQSLGMHIDFTHASPGEGLIGVATGKFDAFICELFEVSDELSKNPVTGVKISGELPESSEFAIIAGPHVREIVPILNKALAAIPAGKKDIIWRKWLRINYEKKLISTIWIKIGLAVIIVMLIAGFIAVRHFYKRFYKIRTTVEALNPHLLSVNVDHNIVITDVTEALCNATGFKTDDLVGKPLLVLGSPVSENSASLDYILETLEKQHSWRGEVKIVKKDGSALWAEAVVSPLRRKSDDNKGFTVIYQDVTQKKHYETLAIRDELTGLYNRRHFNTAVPLLLQQTGNGNRNFAMLLLDVDNFKKYNDTYGHPAGDRVLVSIAGKMEEIIQRNNDMVFRLGGEEFGAVIVVSSTDDVILIAEKVLDAVRALKIEHRHNQSGIVTVSIGLAVTGGEKKPDLETIYKKADTALYKAKKNGRNTYVIL